ncbi:orotidine 5'-phosphate decarboxylase [Irineochytrium annulatum]|nr:orotidine 5'-phosphate decarboxylase [Irineochytrium annulatum]
MSTSPESQRYGARAARHTNPTASRLLKLMDRKQTNLCLSADVTSCASLLRLADLTGPHICLLKTHADILSDFTPKFIEDLTAIAAKHDFLIFEDRKFADIGNTVRLQYSAGLHRIVEWSDVTNAHVVPGEGVIKGLEAVGAAKGRALLLLAEMSSAGSLATGTYTDAALAMAVKNKGFVVGFIGQRRLSDDEFIYMTPGVGMGKGDGLGQVYRTPRDVVLGAKCDVIIVGRGIIEGEEAGDEGVVKRAIMFKEEGWKAYEERVGGGAK